MATGEGKVITSSTGSRKGALGSPSNTNVFGSPSMAVLALSPLICAVAPSFFMMRVSNKRLRICPTETGIRGWKQSLAI